MSFRKFPPFHAECPRGCCRRGKSPGGKSRNSSQESTKPKQSIRTRPGFPVFHYFSSPLYLGAGKFRKCKPNNNIGKHIQFSSKADKTFCGHSTSYLKNMKNARKGQHQPQNGFMTLLLFLKTLQCKLEIWEGTLPRLHFWGFGFPHSRIHLSIPSYSLWVGIRHISGYYEWEKILCLKQAQKSSGDQGRPRPRTGTGDLRNRHKPSSQNFCSWLIPLPIIKCDHEVISG